ncbi:hypothetical protein NPIL_566021 [Nephila pilipes]|uniref:Uncharacterized protein n=1 Tax=Nephila pilipes TaxID=299642 RepID=A0A8X6UN40_NEPPI|nr:hypothetical protein NPIL_566021 [Nephila pilipes]
MDVPFSMYNTETTLRPSSSKTHHYLNRHCPQTHWTKSLHFNNAWERTQLIRRRSDTNPHVTILTQDIYSCSGVEKGRG